MMGTLFVSLCFPPLLSSCGFNVFFFFSSSLSEREREMREVKGRGKTWAGCCRNEQWPARLFSLACIPLISCFLSPCFLLLPILFAAMMGHGFFCFFVFIPCH
ncbi:hypothetical protein J3F84DRAFT_274324 [Trichoderma pleuroticola]